MSPDRVRSSHEDPRGRRNLLERGAEGSCQRGREEDRYYSSCSGQLLGKRPDLGSRDPRLCARPCETGQLRSLPWGASQLVGTVLEFSSGAGGLVRSCFWSFHST